VKGVVAALAIVLAATGADARLARHAKSASGPPKASATRNTDGEWRVEATTSVGACGGLIPGSLTIADHKIASASGVSATIWGYVDEAGQIVARFTETSGRVVRLHGQLGETVGSGAWSSSTDLCGGVWHATRN